MNLFQLCMLTPILHVCYHIIDLTSSNCFTDSLGEYLATAVAFEKLGDITGNPKAKLLADCLTKAVGRILNNRKSPSRRVKEIDNRATNFYV